MISNPSLPLLLLAASVASASDSKPPTSGHAFNWLDPEKASCKMLTEEDLAKLSTCSVNTNAFGLSLTSHACKVDSRTELMIYKTAAECQEALETMQANGP